MTIEEEIAEENKRAASSQFYVYQNFIWNQKWFREYAIIVSRRLYG